MQIIQLDMMRATRRFESSGRPATLEIARGIALELVQRQPRQDTISEARPKAGSTQSEKPVRVGWFGNRLPISS